MSTKVAENCPECGHANLPTDTVKVVKNVPFRPWRYHCEHCGWSWANDLQREHNDREWERMFKSVHCPSMYL